MPDSDAPKGRGRRRRRAVSFMAAAAIVETLAMRLRGFRVGRDVVVRCRDGHLFTTTWLPGGSLKSLRFVWWRFERCPVGRHWSLVTPVRESALSRREKRFALAHHDTWIP
jgi:hypothetical protein